MTYKTLVEKILALPEQQQQLDVTVSMDVAEEAIPVKELYCILEDDFLGNVLDTGHPVLTVDF